MALERDESALEESNPYRVPSRPSREVSPYLLTPLRSLEDAMRARNRRGALAKDPDSPPVPQQLAS